MPEIKLHLGCGEQIKKGWVNIDSGDHYSNKSDVDIACDLSKGIPFPEKTVDYIYHEHLIEHLERSSALDFTIECYRVLKPGGVLRIACPDLSDLIATYLQNDFDSKDWIKNICPQYLGLPRAQVFNIAMREWGHKHIYDSDDLILLLREAGFTNDIRICEVGKSNTENLKNLETRSDSFVVEATKQ